MKTLLKYTAAAVLTGALAFAAVTPSQARDGRNAAAAIGFGAGAIVGAAAASSYNNGYYYGEPTYAYGPDYAYGADYAYEPAPAYVQPAPNYSYRGAPMNSARRCGLSPASPNFGLPC